VEFITNNLTGMILLWIGKQWSDSGNNNIGEKGAIAIADRLM
jgi:hypothetical protein